jgi:hypothetical protein
MKEQCTNLMITSVYRITLYNLGINISLQVTTDFSIYCHSKLKKCNEPLWEQSLGLAVLQTLNSATWFSCCISGCNGVFDWHKWSWEPAVVRGPIVDNTAVGNDSSLFSLFMYFLMVLSLAYWINVKVTLSLCTIRTRMWERRFNSIHSCYRH